MLYLILKIPALSNYPIPDLQLLRLPLRQAECSRLLRGLGSSISADDSEGEGETGDAHNVSSTRCSNAKSKQQASQNYTILQHHITASSQVMQTNNRRIYNVALLSILQRCFSQYGDLTMGYFFYKYFQLNATRRGSIYSPESFVAFDVFYFVQSVSLTLIWYLYAR